MLPLQGELVMFGGQSQVCSSDLRFFDLHKKEWKTDKREASIFDPDGRFGHSLNKHNNHLVLYGGGGSYNKRMKARFTYSDVRLYDLSTNQWLEQDLSRLSSRKAVKRIYFASCIFGGALLV